MARISQYRAVWVMDSGLRSGGRFSVRQRFETSRSDTSHSARDVIPRYQRSPCSLFPPSPHFRLVHGRELSMKVVCTGLLLLIWQAPSVCIDGAGSVCRAWRLVLCDQMCASHVAPPFLYTMVGDSSTGCETGSRVPSLFALFLSGVLVDS